MRLVRLGRNKYRPARGRPAPQVCQSDEDIKTALNTVQSRLTDLDLLKRGCSDIDFDDFGRVTIRTGESVFDMAGLRHRLNVCFPLTVKNTILEPTVATGLLLVF